MPAVLGGGNGLWRPTRTERENIPVPQLSDFPVEYWIVGGVLAALTVFFLVYAFVGQKPAPRRRPLPPPPASRPVGQRYVSGQQRMTMGNRPYDADRTVRIDPDKTRPVARRPVDPRTVRR